MSNRNKSGHNYLELFPMEYVCGSLKILEKLGLTKLELNCCEHPREAGAYKLINKNVKKPTMSKFKRFINKLKLDFS